jgi:cysteinyl-tRNA synthetase
MRTKSLKAAAPMTVKKTWKVLLKYWVHNGFVTVEGEKMSKSLGNFTLTHDLLTKGIKGETIRFTLLSGHYRQPLDWTAEGLHQAQRTLDRYYTISCTS